MRYEIASLHKEIAAEQDKTRKLSRDLEEASVRLLVLLFLTLPFLSAFIIAHEPESLADTGGGLQKAHRRCEELERQMQKLHEELSQKSREVVKLREEGMCLLPPPPHNDDHVDEREARPHLTL